MGSQEPKEKHFLKKIQKKLTYKKYNETYDLIQEINRSSVSLLQDLGYFQSTSFDATVHPTASISLIEKSRINEFVEIAGQQRGFPLKSGTPVKKVLTHLDLLNDSEKLYHATLLAFTDNPQKYFPTAIVKCAHFHGKRVEKPIPAQAVIKGDVFTQITGAIDFVLSKIHISVGTRKESNQAGFAYEIPREVVSEAIVNAVAHRDYNSNGSVEVRLFKDRLEISNPGRLTKELSIEKLEQDHGSYPFNPRLAEILYQTAYIERFGTGTSDIFTKVREAGLTKPEFDLSEGIKIIIWRPTDYDTGQATIHDAKHNSDHDPDHDTDHDTDQAGKIQFKQIDNLIYRLILVFDGEMSRQELMDKLELKHRPTFRINYLNPALDEGLIEMTLPDSLKSKRQKYRLTEKGRELQKRLLNEFNKL